MTDYSSEIYTLQNARVDMQAVKAKNRARIQAKYKNVIANEIAEADQAAELHFAKMLKEANDNGVPQSLLRKEVLRTNVWDRWTYWRDMAGIAPERVILANAREQASKTFEWLRPIEGKEAGLLHALRNADGKPIDIKLPVYFENDMVGIDRIMNDEYPGDEAINEAFGSYGKALAYIEPIVRTSEQKEES